MGTVSRHVSIPADVSRYRLPNTTITGTDRRVIDVIPPSDSNVISSVVVVNPSDNNNPPSDNNNPPSVVVVNPSDNNNAPSDNNLVVAPQKTGSACPGYQAVINSQIVGFVRVFMFFTSLVLFSIVYYACFVILPDVMWQRVVEGIGCALAVILCWSLVRHLKIDYGDSCRMDKPSDKLRRILWAIKGVMVSDFCLVSIPALILNIVLTSIPSTAPSAIGLLNQPEIRRWIRFGFVGLSALMTILMMSYLIKLQEDPIVKGGFPESALVNYRFYGWLIWTSMVVRTVALGVLVFRGVDFRWDTLSIAGTVFLQWVMTVSSYAPGSSF